MSSAPDSLDHRDDFKAFISIDPTISIWTSPYKNYSQITTIRSSMSSDPDTASLGNDDMPAKRTRILAKAQSKTGCFTCKARKVRCDEAKPICQRCIKANFQCEGYPNRDHSHVNARLRNSASNEFQPDDSIPFQQDPLIAMPEIYTMEDVISLLCRGGPVDIGSAVLSQILLETAILWPSAIAALRVLKTLTSLIGGAALIDESVRVQINTDYGEAVHLLSSEISQRQLDTTTVVITCIIMTAVEILSRRTENAMKHFTAALALSKSQTSPNPIFVRFACLFRIYDIQIMLCCDGVRLPTVQAFEPSQLDNLPNNEDDYEILEHYMINLLHSTHGYFTRMNNQALVDGVGKIDTEKKQAYTGLLLSVNEDIIKRLAAESAIHLRRSLLMLQNLCLMTHMQLQQIDSNTEMSWDKYTGAFKTIVENAEKILMGSTFTQNNRESPAFTLQLGVIPPISLTAFKCRHPVLRRRAIACLCRAGVEGPFVGTLLGAMATRCMEIEEAGTQNQRPRNSMSRRKLSRMEASDTISEARRITKCCTIENDGDMEGNPYPLTSSGKTRIKILRRRLPSLSIGANIVSSPYFQADFDFEVLRHQVLNPEIWEEWTETLWFGGWQELL